MKQQISLHFWVILQVLLMVPGSAESGEWQHFTSGTHVTAIADDGEFLWIGCEGLVKLNKTTGTFEYFNKNNSFLLDNFINDILIDKQKNVWIATANGLNRISQGNWMFYDYRSFAGFSCDVRAMTLDKSNTLWMVVGANALIAIDKESWSFYYYRVPIESLGMPYSLAIDSTGNKWIAARGGILIFKGFEWQVIDTWHGLPFALPAYAINIDATNTKWISTGSGLYKVDSTGWQKVNPETDIVALTRDREGRLWAGTRYNGLARLDSNQWTFFNRQNSGLSSNRIRTLKFDEQNHLWAGTVPFYENSGQMKGGGLCRYNGTNWKTYTFGNSGLGNGFIYAIAIDSTGKKWFGTANGLYSYDGNGWNEYNRENSPLPGSAIRALIADNKNLLWIGTQDSGLFKFDSQKWEVFNTENSLLPENSILALQIDKNNDLWIGGARFLAKLSGDSWTSFDASNTGFTFYYVNSIQVDHENNVWILAGDLFKYDGSTWTRFPLDRTTTLQIDAEDRIWIGRMPIFVGDRPFGHAGLLVFDGTDWTENDVYAGASDWVTALHFDKQQNLWIGMNPNDYFSRWYEPMYNWRGGLLKYDGTTFTEFNFGNSGLSDNNIYCFESDQQGHLWIGTGGSGVSVYREGGIVSVTSKIDHSTETSSIILKTFPNPFNSQTQILYSVNEPSVIQLEIYNLLGRIVKRLAAEYQLPGDYQIAWDGCDANGGKAASGVYFCRLTAVAQSTQKILTRVKKLVLLE